MIKFNARLVETAKPGKYGDGGGLQYIVSKATMAASTASGSFGSN
jgi:hypothetical protein